jgi:hypothetical protein
MEKQGGNMTKGLTKFQEQDLMASVEMLENLKNKTTDTFGEYSIINKSFVKIINTIKNINPTLFSYPQVAKHIENPEYYETNKILKRIAVALERANSLEHILSQDELDFLSKKKIVKKRKPRRSRGEINGEITRKYINKLNKENK